MTAASPTPAASADDLSCAPSGAFPDYRPVALAPRRDGWTAARQRLFLDVLAQTGSIASACRAVNMTPRSAYRLRCHPAGAPFARAWQSALTMAAPRLLTIAYERALHGSRRSLWRDGELVAETQAPSDRLLMFLLRTQMPRICTETPAAERRYDNRQEQAHHGFPALLGAIADVAAADCPGEAAWDEDGADGHGAD